MCTYAVTRLYTCSNDFVPCSTCNVICVPNHMLWNLLDFIGFGTISIGADTAN